MTQKIRILVIDSDNETQKQITSYLTNQNWELEFASTAAEGLERIRNYSPEIVVIDYNLPDRTGLNISELKKHKEMEDIEKLHIIGMSSKQEKGIETKMLNRGAHDFILKPFSKEDFIAKINVGKRIITKLCQSEHEFEKMFEKFDILLIQDGGCAPGYNPVTAFLTNYLEENDREVYCAAEGYKSLVIEGNKNFFRLIYDTQTFKRYDHIKNVFNVSLLSEARGAQFRSERFPQFAEEQNLKKAAKIIKKKKVQAIVAIGGNGTFAGLKELMEYLPNTIQLFFIPVTIDSDVSGTETIGEHTGVELGAEKLRCYLADARTHKRIYVIELMGARGGFHALHSCIGARAHFAALPNIPVNYKKLVEALNKKSSAVMAVAEGFDKENREKDGIKVDAAKYFEIKLKETNIPLKLKIVCESFSRDIRGAAPNNLDITLAQRMAYSVAKHLIDGDTRLMPAIEGPRESIIPFSQIGTENTVNSSLLKIANRLYID